MQVSLKQKRKGEEAWSSNKKIRLIAKDAKDPLSFALTTMP